MTNIVFIFVYTVLLQVIHGYNNNDDPKVKTPLGEIQGSIIESLLGKPIYSFRGIRYAKAPVGELRFQPPIPVEKWNGTYDATKDGPMCPQPVVRPISEDCLSLNVYTTKLPLSSYNPNRPVILFIHPGGFYSMSSASNFLGPQYLLDQDIVLVTINYRLGSLGFMSTGDNLVPGNNGLKDQVVALKWVKDNIASFGGNQNLVTIVGCSAGSGSVAMHMLSPMSRGLFHRGIAMSGNILAQWPIEHHQFHLAQKQARLVGCPDDNSQNILNCLKTKSAEELGDSLQRFTEFGFDPILIWTPVIELDFGQERFLIEHPIKTATKGDIAKVPFMSGVTLDELSYLGIELSNKPELLKEMDEQFDRIAPISFMYERNTTKSKLASHELRKKFLGLDHLDSSSIEGLGYLYADGLVGFGTNRGIKLLSSKNSEQTYYYMFSYQGRFSYATLPNTTTTYGVSHHDDLIYLFYTSWLFPKFNVTDSEYEMVKTLTTLHTNFAYTGNPTPHQNGELDSVKWEPFTPQNNKYMDIGKTLKMKQNLYEERYSVWDRLFPLGD